MIDVILRLNEDGSVTVFNQHDAALWCQRHGKWLKIAIGEAHPTNAGFMFPAPEGFPDAFLAETVRKMQ